MNVFVDFIVSPLGRLARVLAGLTLIAWGLLGMDGTAGIVVAVIGAIPLLAGVFNFCLITQLSSCPILAARARGNK